MNFLLHKQKTPKKHEWFCLELAKYRIQTFKISIADCSVVAIGKYKMVVHNHNLSKIQCETKVQNRFPLFYSFLYQTKPFQQFYFSFVFIAICLPGWRLELCIHILHTNLNFKFPLHLSNIRNSYTSKNHVTKILARRRHLDSFTAVVCSAYCIYDDDNLT